MDKIKSNMSNTTLINNNLFMVLRNALESLELFGYTKRKVNIINIVIPHINDIKMVIIAFTGIMTYIDKIGYSSISQIVGNNIMYAIYKDQLNKSYIT
jgi:hypothetical protein